MRSRAKARDKDMLCNIILSPPFIRRFNFLVDRAKGACTGQPVQVTMWMRTSSDDWYVSTNMCMYLRCHVTWSGDGSGDGWRVARGHYSMCPP